MNEQNTNWGQSVTGVLIKDGKVLLARHTYGAGTGKLIVPGGYVNYGETPQNALIREYQEETGIIVEPENIIGMRFNMHDWYIAFRVRYVSGEAASDNDENSEVLWIGVNEALQREDVPDLTKKLIQSAVSDDIGLRKAAYDSTSHSPNSLYCL